MEEALYASPPISDISIGALSFTRLVVNTRTIANLVARASRVKLQGETSHLSLFFFPFAARDSHDKRHNEMVLRLGK